MKRKRASPSWIVLAVLLALGGCATRPVNPPITKVDLDVGYTFQARLKHFKSQENIVVLAFSGGGTRAAAFSYGVLEFLRRTEVVAPNGATVRLIVRKDLQVQEPQFLTSGPLIPRVNTAPYYATDGIGPDLLEAARSAIRHMIDYLQRTRKLSRAEAYMLCSVVVDLKISEIVDAPNWVVSAFLPLSIFQQ